MKMQWNRNFLEVSVQFIISFVNYFEMKGVLKLWKKFVFLFLNIMLFSNWKCTMAGLGHLTRDTSRHQELTILTVTNRSSHRRRSVRKGVLRNFAKFIGKHLCQINIISTASKDCFLFISFHLEHLEYPWEWSSVL